MMSIGPCPTNFNKSSALPAKPRARSRCETVGVWAAQAAHSKLIGYPIDGDIPLIVEAKDVTMFESTFGGP